MESQLTMCAATAASAKTAARQEGGGGAVPFVKPHSRTTLPSDKPLTAPTHPRTP